MKTTLSLLMLLLLTSCELPKMAYNSEDGVLVPASHLDGLRGMASGKRDAEMMRFADAIIAKAGRREVDNYGTVYPGTVKVLRWTHRGETKYTAMRLATWPGSNMPPTWQGPTPPSGFYASKVETQILN
jgi:hypothetical protein